MTGLPSTSAAQTFLNSGRMSGVRTPGGMWISPRSSLRRRAAAASCSYRWSRAALGLACLGRGPYPGQVLGEPLAPVGVRGALDSQPGGLPVQVARVVARVRVGMAVVEFQDPLGHVVQEIPVVAGRYHRARVGVQMLFEPLDAV